LGTKLGLDWVNSLAINRNAVARRVTVLLGRRGTTSSGGPRGYWRPSVASRGQPCAANSQD